MGCSAGRAPKSRELLFSETGTKGLRLQDSDDLYLGCRLRGVYFYQQAIGTFSRWTWILLLQLPLIEENFIRTMDLTQISRRIAFRQRGRERSRTPRID